MTCLTCKPCEIAKTGHGGAIDLLCVGCCIRLLKRLPPDRVDAYLKMIERNCIVAKAWGGADGHIDEVLAAWEKEKA